LSAHDGASRDRADGNQTRRANKPVSEDRLRDALPETTKHETPHAHPDGSVSTRASTVTYTRDADGNLLKVRRPAIPSPKTVPVALPVASKARAAKKPCNEAGAAKPRPAAKHRSDNAWTLPIPPVVRAVAESVAARYGVSVDAMLSGERFRDTVRARHAWWRLVKDTWDLSYPETGRLVGGVDHTTIMSALREREVVARKVGAQVVKNKDANHTRKMSPNQPVGTL
jgi:hypothetical protein